MVFGIFGKRPPAADGDGRIERFMEAMLPHAPRLYEVARLLCQDPAWAEDLVQEALLRAFRSVDRFQPDQPAMPWLVTILRNAFRDDVRSARTRHETRWEEGVEERWLEATAEPAPSQQTDLELAELGRLVRGWIDQIPQHYALPLLLVDLQESSYEEAAAALSVPLGTLRSRLARGRALLRARWLQHRELNGEAFRTPDSEKE